MTPPPTISSAPPVSTSNNNSGIPQITDNFRIYSESAQKTAQLLNLLSDEYESTIDGGQSQIPLPEISRLADEIDAVVAQVDRLPAPNITEARQMRADIDGIVSAILRGRLAENRFEKKHNLFLGSSSHGIGYGMDCAERLLAIFQQKPATLRTSWTTERQ